MRKHGTSIIVAEKNHILGLDVGNTVIKAVLFDTAGRQVAHHAIDGHSTFPPPRYVARDLEELWLSPIPL